MRYLTFALGKGRLALQTLNLFEKIGITCEEMKDKLSGYLNVLFEQNPQAVGGAVPADSFYYAYEFPG